MTNYTPIHIESMYKQTTPNPQQGLDVTVIFLTLILITLVILAGLLFVLIQQRISELSFAVRVIA